MHQIFSLRNTNLCHRLANLDLGTFNPSTHVSSKKCNKEISQGTIAESWMTHIMDLSVEGCMLELCAVENNCAHWKSISDIPTILIQLSVSFESKGPELFSEGGGEKLWGGEKNQEPSDGE